MSELDRLAGELQRKLAALQKVVALGTSMGDLLLLELLDRDLDFVDQFFLTLQSVESVLLP